MYYGGQSHWWSKLDAHFWKELKQPQILKWLHKYALIIINNIYVDIIFTKFAVPINFRSGSKCEKKATQNQNIHVVNQDNESATSNDELCTEIT